MCRKASQTCSNLTVSLSDSCKAPVRALHGLHFTSSDAAFNPLPLNLTFGTTFSIAHIAGVFLLGAYRGATRALIRRRSLKTIDVPRIGWLQLIDEFSGGKDLLKGPLQRRQPIRAAASRS